MTVIAPRCPKCGATMIGPKYNGPTNMLTYVCACGYRDSRPPLDGGAVLRPLKGPTGGHGAAALTVEDLARIAPMTLACAGVLS